MWVLCVADLHLPVGEIVYVAGIVVTVILVAVTNTSSEASTIPQDNVTSSKGNSASTQSGAANSGIAGGAASPPPDKDKNFLSFSKEFKGDTFYNKNGVRVDYEYNGNGTGNVHLHTNGRKYYYHKQGYLTNVLNDPNSAAAPHIQKLLHNKEIMKAILKGIYYIQNLGGHI